MDKGGPEKKKPTPRRGCGRCSAAARSCIASSSRTRPAWPTTSTAQSLTGELFITQITLYPRRGTRQYDEVYDEIARVITQVVAELPEALNFLRGRAFVRALH